MQDNLVYFGGSFQENEYVDARKLQLTNFMDLIDINIWFWRIGQGVLYLSVTCE
jgi:hypothetical protein